MSRFDDCIEKTQALTRLCRAPGFLKMVWGTHTASGEGVFDARVQVVNYDMKGEEADRYAATHLHGLFRHAEPYFVDAHLQEAIEVAAPGLPMHVRLREDLFPTRYGCLFFDRPVKDMPHRLLTARPGMPQTEPAPMSGFAWQAGGGGVTLVFLYSWAVDTSTPSHWLGYDVSNVPLVVTPWTFGESTLASAITFHNGLLQRNDEESVEPDPKNMQRFTMSVRICVATLLLMSQTLTERSHLPVDRPARRRAAHTGWEREPNVYVVKLRRVEHKHDADYETAHVDWSCRWAVSAHWRTLHRGTPDERTVLVHAYVKGPADRPFRAPRNRVWALVR